MSRKENLALHIKNLEFRENLVLTELTEAFSSYRFKVLSSEYKEIRKILELLRLDFLKEFMNESK
ncbi:MAG: hypothetical protein Q8P20_01165 [bacterium]|nr:hypothetical protein [bacterium]